LAVLFAYLDRGFPDAGHDVTALALVEQSISSVAEREMVPWLAGGFSGVGWMAAHLDGWLLDVAANDACQAVDEALEELLDRRAWIGRWGLTTGLAGLGVYALERLPHPRALSLLTQIVRHFENGAEHSEECISWRDDPRSLPSSVRAQLPTGSWDPGVSHGVAGIVGFLACLQTTGAVPQCRSLLRGSVDWLLAQRRMHWRDAFYPYHVAPGVEDAPARLAWCQGDVGIGMALLLAARSEKENAWEAAALQVLRRAAHRSLATVVDDQAICHGASGLAQVFQRLYRLSHEVVFLDAARRCLLQVLDEGPTRDTGILSGSAGVALTLLAATTSVEPQWDRFLLLSPSETR